MNDRLNAPVEPHDDGTVQDDPLYQEPSEGIVTQSEPSVSDGSTAPDTRDRNESCLESSRGSFHFFFNQSAYAKQFKGWALLLVYVVDTRHATI